MKNTQSTFRNRRQLATLFALAALLIFGGSWTYTDASAEDVTENEARTVLITGANRGIGLELARQYSKAGWRIIGTARKPDDAHDLKELGADVMQLDVTVQESVDQLAQDLGNRPIDLLINNAGILPVMWTLAEVDIDVFNRIIAVNTVGPVRVTRAVLPNLRSGKTRMIVNTTSVLGSIGQNADGGFYGYRESKAALNMFTKSLAAELGPEDFICIVIHPGWVQTDMGGENAPTPVQDSVRGIRRVIDGLSREDNGTYWTFEGKQLPW